jgi:hypothetical protein
MLSFRYIGGADETDEFLRHQTIPKTDHTFKRLIECLEHDPEIKKSKVVVIGCKDCPYYQKAVQTWEEHEPDSIYSIGETWENIKILKQKINEKKQHNAHFVRTTPLVFVRVQQTHHQNDQQGNSNKTVLSMLIPPKNPREMKYSSNKSKITDPESEESENEEPENEESEGEETESEETESEYEV